MNEAESEMIAAQLAAIQPELAPKDECLGWHAIHDAAETGDTGDIQVKRDVKVREVRGDVEVERVLLVLLGLLDLPG